MRLPCVCHAFAVRSPRRCVCHAFAMRLPCVCRAFAMRLPCVRHGIALHAASCSKYWLRVRRGVRSLEAIAQPPAAMPSAMAAQIEAARRAANAAQDAYNWGERYWSYGGATGYWSAAQAALPASRRTSYECWTEIEFSDEFGVRPQDAGLGLVPHQHGTTSNTT